VCAPPEWQDPWPSPCPTTERKDEPLAMPLPSGAPEQRSVFFPVLEGTWNRRCPGGKAASYPTLQKSSALWLTPLVSSIYASSKRAALRDQII